MGVVYKITNLVNGKLYVGQTTCTEAKRWREHKCAARKQNPKLAIHRAMAKYGFDSFAMEVIDSADSQEELSLKEVEWIVKLNSGTLGHGYNLTAGGEGCSMTDPATKEKIGAKTKARWQDPAMRQHYAENVWTEERRAQYSDQSIAFYATPEGQAAKEAMRAKISKMRTCEACKGVFNGRAWQKHSPSKCPAMPPVPKRVKTEAERLAAGNGVRGTKRPLDEVARKAEASRLTWTPEKRAAWGERMRKAAAARPKVTRTISVEQRAKQSATMKGRKVRLGIKNSPEANRNVSEALYRGWETRRAAEANGNSIRPRTQRRAATEEEKIRQSEIQKAWWRQHPEAKERLSAQVWTEEKRASARAKRLAYLASAKERMA